MCLHSFCLHQVAFFCLFSNLPFISETGLNHPNPWLSVPKAQRGLQVKLGAMCKGAFVLAAPGIPPGKAKVSSFGPLLRLITLPREAGGLWLQQPPREVGWEEGWRLGDGVPTNLVPPTH